MKWAVVTLEQVTSKVGSGATPRGGDAAYRESGVTLVRSMNVRFEGFSRKGLAFISDEQAAGLDNAIVQTNDVLFNITGASIGRVCLAPPEIAGARVNQHVCIIRPTKFLSSHFLTFFLASAAQQQMINGCQSGGTRQALTKKQLLEWRCPLPPLSEQRRIVELLEQADALRRRRADADSVAERILPALFRKMFGDPLSNPRGLPTDSLNNLLACLRNGTTFEQNQLGRGHPVTRIETISAGVIDPARVRYVEMDDAANSKWKLEIGDVLFSHINSESHIGKTAIYRGSPAPLIHGMNLLLMRSIKSRIMPEYLFAVLNSDSVRAAFRQRCKRAVNQASLNQNDIASMEIVVPKMEEQRRFCRLAESSLRDYENRHYSSKTLETLFQTLLYRAFTGELTAGWREARMKELLAEMEIQARHLASAQA